MKPKSCNFLYIYDKIRNIQINVYKWRNHSEIPKGYTGRHYFLFHINFLQILTKVHSQNPSNNHYYLQQQKNFFSNYRKDFITVWKMGISGEKAPQLLSLLFVYMAQKEICQVPTLEFLKPLILDQCGFLGEVSWL